MFFKSVFCRVYDYETLVLCLAGVGFLGLNCQIQVEKMT